LCTLTNQKLNFTTIIADYHCQASLQPVAQIKVMKYLAWRDFIICIFYITCTQDTKMTHGSWMLLVICYLRPNFHAQCNNINVKWKGLVHCQWYWGFNFDILSWVCYLFQTNMVTPPAIYFIYLGQEYISCILRHRTHFYFLQNAVYLNFILLIPAVCF
jgi:hypothetical protein